MVVCGVSGVCVCVCAGPSPRKPANLAYWYPSQARRARRCNLPEAPDKTKPAKEKLMAK